MAKVKQDSVFELIQSMSKSEKRAFKLFATRMSNSKDAHFLLLFEAMEAISEYDEKKILQRSKITKEQLPGAKLYLLKQILISLRQTNSDRYSEIDLHEQLDFARILYSKRLYKESLKVLQKAKKRAQDKMLFVTELEIIDFERVIHAQYNTTQHPKRADELAGESLTVTNHIAKINEFANLSLKLYDLYLKRGHVKNRNDIVFMEDFLHKNRPSVDLKNQSLYEVFYYNLSYYWYYYILQEFTTCYKYIKKNKELFQTHQQMRINYSTFYIRTLNCMMETLFYLQHYPKLKEEILLLKQEIDSKQSPLDPNDEVLAKTYYYTNSINLFFTMGKFTEGLEIIQPLLQFIKSYKSKIDQHQILLFYYKIACLYFGSGDNHNAILHLNNIINYSNVNIRSDLQCFARLLRLIAVYESGDTWLLEYQLKSSYRFLANQNNLQGVQKEIFGFLKAVVKNDNKINVNEDLRNLLKNLRSYEKHPYEKRAFLYLDVISWIESKLEHISVESVIYKKFKEKNTVQPNLD